MRPPAFVSTRNLYPVYDVGTLVRAARTISDARPDVRGAILGDGPQGPELRRLAQDLRLGDGLRFEGAVGEDRVMSVLGDARIYISTSTSDGASVSLLEAMAQGCFPVVTDIPANREWIASGRNGLLVPVGDAPALGAAVLSAIDDEPLLEAASRTNVALVVERGDLSKNLARVESRYRLLSEARAE
jgi:glycosyltransferase involved in cell wall biosynthesis